MCVFCGSSRGRDRHVQDAATDLARELSERGLGLVYGGSSIGIMGHLADEATRRGVEVIGVIPRSLADRELAHGGLSELHVVSTLHDRKSMMERCSDAFLTLPGGLGTLDELFEVLTWRQLSVVHKPIGLLNVEDYYAGLLEFLSHGTELGFVPPTWPSLLTIDTDPGRLLSQLFPDQRAD